MDEKANQDNLLTYLNEKNQERIKAGRDKLTVKQHGAMEVMLINMKNLLVPGEIITPGILQPEENEQFQKLRITLDLSPFAYAVFFPSGIYQTINSHKVLQKIASDFVPDNKSIKILVCGIKDYNRILTAEISPDRPSIDIYDNGSLLASYNYNTSNECTDDLSKIIWIHFKYKEAWNHNDYIKYTESWFFRSASYKIPNLSINVNHSYIHHPVLINSSTIQAIFKLMQATLTRLFDDPEKIIPAANAANLYKINTVKITKQGLLKGKEDEEKSLRRYYEDRLMGLMKLLQGYDIINFKSFSASGQNDFKRMFSKTIEDVFQVTMQKIGDNKSGQLP